MRSRTSLTAAVSFVFAAAVAPPGAGATTPPPTARTLDLGQVLPGTLHGGFFSNFQLLLQDFPGIAHEGWLGEQIDAWVAKGYPDPRDLAGQMGVGINVDVGRRRLKDVVVLGQGPLQLARRVREIARRANLPVQEIPYRGVVFVRPMFEELPLWVAEAAEGVSHFHYSADRKFRASKQMVHTLAGEQASFADKHDMSLTPETYLVAGVSVPVAKEERAARLRGPRTAGLHLVIHASVDWRRSGSMVKLGVELETFTPVEASLLARWLRGRLEWLKEKTTQPVLREFLEYVVIRNQGKHVFLELKKDFQLIQQGLLAMNREFGPGLASELQSFEASTSVRGM